MPVLEQRGQRHGGRRGRPVVAQALGDQRLRDATRQSVRAKWSGGGVGRHLGFERRRARADRHCPRAAVALAHGVVVGRRRWREWPGMSVVTSRSRKRRRSPAGPVKRPSIAGVSQRSAQIVAHLLDGAGIGAVDADAAAAIGRRRRCRYRPGHQASRWWRRRPRAGRSLVGERSRSWRGAGRGRAPAARWPRADWSCPRHWGRSAPDGGHRDRGRRRHSCGRR